MGMPSLRMRFGTRGGLKERLGALDGVAEMIVKDEWDFTKFDNIVLCMLPLIAHHFQIK